MSELDQLLETCVAEGLTPAVFVSFANRKGVIYEGAAGPDMIRETIFRAFSMTKAVGAVAAAKAIEEGLVSLDTPVEDLLPEWRDIQVLEGFDDDGHPLLRKPKTVATLRHLASHTSGLVYETWNPNQFRYLKYAGSPPMRSGLKEAFRNYHLAFDPGTDWQYGVGVDWLGRMIEAATGERIDAWCRSRIFEPLGMVDTVFELDEERAARRYPAVMRKGDGFQPLELGPASEPEVYCMGHALFTTGPDYLRFLRMLLSGGENVLKPETAEMLLANQIGDLSLRRMETALPQASASFEFFPEQEKKFSLACMVNTQDVPGRRRAGSQSWAGLMNTHYWFDPASDIAAVIMMQQLPFMDPGAVEVYDRVERAIYAGMR